MPFPFFLIFFCLFCDAQTGYTIQLYLCFAPSFPLSYLYIKIRSQIILIILFYPDQIYVISFPKT